MFLYSIIVPVFPFSLVERLHISESEVQHWVSVLLSVYGVALLVGAPVFGILADKLEQRRLPLLIGIVALTGATTTLCLATSIPVLIVGRILQGFSASITWVSQDSNLCSRTGIDLTVQVVGLTLLADTAHKDTVAQSFGYVGAASSLGTIIGPVIGGTLYQRAGYYSVFAVCFALLGFDIFLRLLIVEKKIAAKWLQSPHISTLQSDAIELSVPGIPVHEITSVSMSNEVTDPGPNAPEPENRKLPAIFALLKSPRMLAAFWGDFTTATVMVSFDTTLALFVSHTFHWSSLLAGLIFLALLLPTFLGPILGMAADKWGARWISVSGMLFMIPPLILLRLVHYDSVSQIVLLCALLMLIGLGAAMALTGLYAEYSKICDAIEMDQPGSLGNNGGYAQSYGISEIAWALAGLIGPLVSGKIYEAAGWGTLGWVLSILCFVTVVPTMLFIKR